MGLEPPPLRVSSMSVWSRRSPALALVLVLLPLSSDAFAQSAVECAATAATTLEAGDVMLRFQLQPSSLQVGQPFAVRACATLGQPAPRHPQRIRFDARMPQHGHGMNYQPSAVVEDGGWHRFEGSLLHMPGRWQLVFDVYDESTRHRLTTDVDITR